MYSFKEIVCVSLNSQDGVRNLIRRMVSPTGTSGLTERQMEKSLCLVFGM